MDFSFGLQFVQKYWPGVIFVCVFVHLKLDLNLLDLFWPGLSPDLFLQVCGVEQPLLLQQLLFWHGVMGGCSESCWSHFFFTPKDTHPSILIAAVIAILNLDCFIKYDCSLFYEKCVILSLLLTRICVSTIVPPHVPHVVWMTKFPLSLYVKNSRTEKGWTFCHNDCIQQAQNPSAAHSHGNKDTHVSANTHTALTGGQEHHLCMFNS